MKTITVLLVSMLAILFIPLVFHGYVMSFDMAWGPNYPVANHTSNIFLVTLAINNFQNVIQGWLVQKIVLMGIIVMAVAGSYKLLIKLIDNRNVILSISILYLFNPFFYTRLIAGQWLVLIGYALLPWATRSIYLFVRNPRWRTAWPVVAWTAAIGLTSIHTIGIVAVVAVALLIYSGRAEWKSKLKYVGIIAGMWLAINAIWLVPFVTGQSNAGHDTLTFSQSEMEAFATKPTVAGSVPLSAALLTGFWADDQNRYILPSQLPIWYVGVAIVMTLVIFGMVLVVKRRDRLGITFFVLAVVAWLLGMGIAWPPSALLTHAITAVFPYFNGYREPQKWLMLLVLCYVYFAAIGADRIYRYIAERPKNELWRYGFITILVIAPFLFAPTLPWGALGQLKSANYPSGWYQTKNYLAATPVSTRIVVFPWHIYLPIDFTGRVVANPAPYFFDQTMVTSDNFELKGVPAQNATPTTTYISTNVLPNTPTITAVGKPLAERYDVSYIMLLKQADWKNYAWLNRQTDLVKVVDNDSIVLYKITEGAH